MSEQPTSSRNQLPPKEGTVLDNSYAEYDQDVSLHESNLGRYDADEIAKVRDALPAAPLPTPEELTGRRVHEIGLQLSELHANRRARIGNGSQTDYNLAA